MEVSEIINVGKSLLPYAAILFALLEQTAIKDYLKSKASGDVKALRTFIVLYYVVGFMAFILSTVYLDIRFVSLPSADITQQNIALWLFASAVESISIVYGYRIAFGGGNKTTTTATFG